jgi:hypothetical protein
MPATWLVHGFDCEIRVDVADNVTERRIPAAKDRIEKPHQLRRELRLRLVEAQEPMTTYYNARHIPKHFRVGDFVRSKPSCPQAVQLETASSYLPKTSS